MGQIVDFPKVARCPHCQGHGLIYDYLNDASCRCALCKGTGKVAMGTAERAEPRPSATYPPAVPWA